MLESAVAAHRQGRLSEADAGYQRILRLQPRHFDALHLAGLLATQRNDARTGVELIGRAIAIDRGQAPAHLNLGNALLALERPAEALASYERAIGLEPGYAEAHSNRGNALKELNRADEALASYERAVALKPDYAEAFCNQGNLLNELDRPAAALASCERAIALVPGLAEAWYNRGNALKGLRRQEEALASYDRAVALKPGYAEAWTNRGNALTALARHDDALASHDRAVALKPGLAQAWSSRGNALRALERPDAALASYDRAIALKPGLVPAWSNRGIALMDLKRLDDALGSFERALALDPRYPEAHYNLGLVRYVQGRVPEGIACHEKAVELKPGYAEAQWSLGVGLLMTGDLDRGWQGYEWRFRTEDPDVPVTVRDFSYPEWHGEPLAGKSVLVWGEQGIGDEILFAGIYREVAAMAGRCLIECTAKLLPLIARSVPGATFAARTTPPQACTRGGFDYQAPAGDLARWLRPALASFPRHDGYLAPPEGRVAYWKERLAALGPGPWIGFGWRSSNLKGPRAAADIKLDRWGPVFTTPGARFVCLQYGECAADLAQARERWGVPLHAFPEVDLFNDLDEAAALTKAVDLVISAPTAVSILAAALGVPTWQLAFGYDWQRHGTPCNPWFPAMTIFHRAVDREWDAILLDVAGELRRWVCGAGHAPRHRDRDLRAERPATD